MTIHVVVSDDHPLVRAGMKAVLSDAADIVVVGEAVSAAGAIEAAVRLRPAVLITDIKLPDGSGVEVCRSAKRANGALRVVLISAYWSEALMREASEARADGYMLKQTENFDLAGTVRAVNRGDSVVDPELIVALAREQRSAPTTTPGIHLSPRERELLELVAGGLTNQGIAAEMFLSQHTVKDYVSDLLTKFGATNRTKLALLAAQRGLLRRLPSQVQK